MKKLPAILFALSSFAMLASCGGGNDGGQSASTPTSSRVTSAVESIAIETLPTKTSYVEGETLDLEGLSIKVTMNTGETEIKRSGFTVDIANKPLTVDMTTATVTYRKKSATFSITVSAVVVKTLAIQTGLGNDLFASQNVLDFSSMVLLATLDDDSTREVSVYDCDSIVDEKGNAITAETLGSALGLGEHTITATYRGKTISFTIRVASGYVIEAEELTDNPNIEDVPGVTNYVFGYKSKGGDLVTPRRGRATGDGQDLCGITYTKNNTSNNEFLGGTKPGNVVEFHFRSEIAQKAQLTLRASSNWMKTDDGNWNPGWVGDVQLNEVFSAYTNGTAMPIADDVILPGSGDKNDTNYTKDKFKNWKDVDFGVLDLVEGWNVVEMDFATTAQLGLLDIDPDTNKPKYQNSVSSNAYGLPGLDCLKVTFLSE